MARITFLGTAASIPSKKRDNTAFVFQHRKETWLIDCPGSPAHKLLKADINFRKIKRIIITHHHPDHIYGITSLIHSQAFISPEPITIFSTSPSIKIIKNLIGLFKLNREQFPRVDFINVRTLSVFYENNYLRIRKISNKHSEESFGVKFIYGKKSFFYSSDTKFSPLILKKAQPFNYLIHDCTASSSYFRKHPAINLMHTCALQLSRYMKRDTCAKIIPVHFLTVERKEEEKIKAELSCLGKRVIWVKDGQRLKL
jgi:ribonuclease BN (tRNA processing enzyme)